VVTRLRADFSAVATGGVACAHELLVNVSRGKTVYLAFDNDCRENPAVARQLAKLVKLRFDDVGNQAETKILVWTDNEKGVDDALLKGEDLLEISFAEWLSVLGEKCRDEVRKIWDEKSFVNLEF
jgi:DNA primase